MKKKYKKYLLKTKEEFSKDLNLGGNILNIGFGKKLKHVNLYEFLLMLIGGVACIFVFGSKVSNIQEPLINALISLFSVIFIIWILIPIYAFALGILIVFIINIVLEINKGIERKKEESKEE